MQFFHKRNHTNTGILLWESMSLWMWFTSGQHKVCYTDKKIKITILPLAGTYSRCSGEWWVHFFLFPHETSYSTAVISRENSKARDLVACIIIHTPIAEYIL